MKKLSTAERLKVHLDKNAKEYYAPIIAKNEKNLHKKRVTEIVTLLHRTNR